MACQLKLNFDLESGTVKVYKCSTVDIKLGNALTDIFDVSTRSRMMSGIKSKDTKPELSIRKALHSRGFRYRLHVKDLPGKPDLVFPKYKAVLLVHGCFWHGHTCRYFKMPKTRTDFWTEKIGKNKKRDLLQIDDLLNRGWRVLLIWECAVRAAGREKTPALTDKVVAWLEGAERYGQMDEECLN